MKQLSARFPLFFGLVFILCAVTACKTTSEPHMSTVIAIAGHAHYRDGDGGKWHAVRLGSLIPQGSVIQTDDGPTNAIRLAIGRQLRFLDSPYHRDLSEPNHLMLYENSVLRLDRVAAKIVAGKRISDTRLVLLAGRVTWGAGTEPTDYFPQPYPPGPKLETIRPQPDKSCYEISNSNVVVHAEGAYFSFSAQKWATVLMGTVAIEFTDTGIIKNVFNYQRYDFVTDEISKFEISSGSSSDPDYLWHYLPSAPFQDGPRYEVPQRPF